VNCPVCKHADHHVLRSKPVAGAIRRRRRCDRCGHTWNTLELDEQAIAADREALAAARRLAAVLEPG
jgi:transcriptional regulator NrdR family protein